jgi:colanic acid/amylovoran biosynthesis glycosyltransferase
MCKRILYVTSHFPFGNGETWSISELKALINKGNSIIIIPRTGRGVITHAEAKMMLPFIIDLPYLNWRIAFSFLQNLLLGPLSLAKLIFSIIKQSNSFNDFVKGMIVLPKSLLISDLLKNERIHHIHAFSTTSVAVVAFIISSKLNIPWSFTVHTSENLTSSFQRSTIFQIQSACFARTICQTTAEDLRKYVGPKYSNKIKVIHLGVETNVRILCRNKYLDKFTIVTPAILRTYKGHIYALDAAKCLLDNGITNFQWDFYGNGPLLNTLLRRVRDLSLNNNVYFHGNIDNKLLINKYRNNEVDAVVLSSISSDGKPEGIPVSLMEAMVYSIPVIATNSGGTVELIGDGCGIIVEQHNSIQLAHEIEILMKHPELRISLGMKGHDKIISDFDISNTSNQLITLISHNSQ